MSEKNTEKILKKYFASQSEPLPEKDKIGLLSSSDAPSKPRFELRRAIISASCLALVFALALTVVLSVSGGIRKHVYAPYSTLDLMQGIKFDVPQRTEPADEFYAMLSSYAFKLFAITCEKRDPSSEGVLISPISTQLTLGLLANDAEGDDLKALENSFFGGMPIDKVNKYFYSYCADISGGSVADGLSRIRFANSVWYKKNMNIGEKYLKICREYYGADAFCAPFDSGTVDDINLWVKKNTDDMIEKIYNSPQALEHAAEVLINTLVFEAEWENDYSRDGEVCDGKFTTYKGDEIDVRYMTGDYDYVIDGENAAGMLQYYKDRRFAFVALLPNEDIDVYEYAASLNPERLKDAISAGTGLKVHSSLPKFSYDFSADLTDILASMGMPGSAGDITVSQKTHIDVAERGTKAAVVTDAELYGMLPELMVDFERPFVYMILDTATGVPIFLGVAALC